MSFEYSLESHLSDFSRTKGIRGIDVTARLPAYHRQLLASSEWVQTEPKESILQRCLAATEAARHNFTVCSP